MYLQEAEGTQQRIKGQDLAFHGGHILVGEPDSRSTGVMAVSDKDQDSGSEWGRVLEEGCCCLAGLFREGLSEEGPSGLWEGL